MLFVQERSLTGGAYLVDSQVLWIDMGVCSSCGEAERLEKEARLRALAAQRERTRKYEAETVNIDLEITDAPVNVFNFKMNWDVRLRGTIKELKQRLTDEMSSGSKVLPDEWEIAFSANTPSDDSTLEHIAVVDGAIIQVCTNESRAEKVRQAETIEIMLEVTDDLKVMSKYPITFAGRYRGSVRELKEKIADHLSSSKGLVPQDAPSRSHGFQHVQHNELDITITGGSSETLALWISEEEDPMGRTLEELKLGPDERARHPDCRLSVTASKARGSRWKQEAERRRKEVVQERVRKLEAERKRQEAVARRQREEAERSAASSDQNDDFASCGCGGCGCGG